MTTENNGERREPPIVDDGMSTQISVDTDVPAQAGNPPGPAAATPSPDAGSAPKTQAHAQTQAPAQADALGGSAGNSDESRPDRVMDFTRKAVAVTGEVVGASYRKTKQALETSNPRACVRMLDQAIQWLRDMFPPARFDALGQWSTRFGHMALVASQALVMLLFLVAAIKLGTAWLFLKGLGYALALIALQYTADKFLMAGGRLIESSPSRVSAPALMDSLALLIEVAGIAAFLGSLALAGQLEQWNLVFVGLGAWMLADAMACIAINPSMVNITRADDVSAGEEALGLLSFFAKALLRIVPIVFGIGTVIGAVGLFAGTLGILFKSGSGLQTGLMPGEGPLKWILACAALPLASYLLFCFYHLAIDLLHAILQIPRKLDEAMKQ